MVADSVFAAADGTFPSLSSDWRTAAMTGQPQLIVWRQLHALKDFMPPELKIAIPDGMTEQEAVWGSMSVEPREWARRVRSAVRQVLDQRVSQSDDLMGAMMKLNPSSTLDANGLGDPMAEFASLLRSPKDRWIGS